jgi:hypothetical protein
MGSHSCLSIMLWVSLTYREPQTNFATGELTGLILAQPSAKLP